MEGSGQIVVVGARTDSIVTQSYCRVFVACCKVPILGDWRSHNAFG